MKSELFTLTETAEMLRISISTLYKYVEKGRIPHLKIGSRVLIASDQLEEWLEGNTRKCND